MSQQLLIAAIAHPDQPLLSLSLLTSRTDTTPNLDQTDIAYPLDLLPCIHWIEVR